MLGKKINIGLVLLFVPALLSVTNSQSRYELSTLFDTNKFRISLAESQIGVREETHHKQIMGYLKAVDIYINAPWCNAFQYWLMDSVCKVLGIDNPMPRSGLANSSYDYAMRKGLKTKFEARPGDLLVWRTEGSWTGHVALVVKKRNNWSVITIEGNTSSNSVRTGGAVEKKVRLTNHPIGRLLVRGLVGFKAQYED